MSSQTENSTASEPVVTLAPAPAPLTVAPELTPPLTSNNTTPRFSEKDVSVIFVLGGPGSGKGTQSANLVREYGFSHLSAGDLLRAEQNREESQYGELIRNYIREGLIVPMKITVALLSNAMADILAEKKAQNQLIPGHTITFLIDGFPRKMDQAIFFEETVVPSMATLFLSCPEEIMLNRLLKRGETSGRSDDNIDSIRKRFRVFVDQSMPVVDHYTKEGKVMSVSSVGSVDERDQEGD
ncbi:LOW QUALITY PROTEIN: UMP-CMP kinase [Coccidioides immitis RMSCC 2394]|uniref:UMP-CMP kinase n=1 Tax=Coccidioides immitis RMSCC 2394 TaxID=404692 RepID=A0A0J6YFW2_COCIT|nr:LOW QUALITY PROTEIN: UMP-CMP kinase [Coccidioides immitis RMSCC 2394]